MMIIQLLKIQSKELAMCSSFIWQPYSKRDSNFTRKTIKAL